MKRMTILLALLLAGMLAAASVMSWGLPDTENLVPGPVERADGTVLAAENRWFTSRIYTLQEGRISEVYEESRIRGGEESRIVRAAALEDGACFIRILNDGADWELVKLENGKAELLHRDTFENEVTVTGLRVQGESFWITAVGANEAIFIYEYTATDGVGLKMILPAWWLWKTVTAEYLSKGCRTVHPARRWCRTQSGRPLHPSRRSASDRCRKPSSPPSRRSA